MKQRSSSQRISKGQFAGYLLTLFIIAGGVANAQNPGVIRGAIVTIDADGSRSIIPGATVELQSGDVARETTADNVGSYTFADLPARATTRSERMRLGWPVQRPPKFTPVNLSRLKSPWPLRI